MEVRLGPASGSPAQCIKDLDGHQNGSTELDGRTVRCQTDTNPGPPGWGLCTRFTTWSYKNNIL